LVRREVGATDISHYILSNAPAETPLIRLVRAQTQRYFIEHSFREAKTECGLADYQVRPPGGNSGETEVKSALISSKWEVDGSKNSKIAFLSENFTDNVNRSALP
jgi:SRSO17 transposase